MLYHIGRVAIVIYLPTLAITSVSNINPIIIASVVGGLCIIYTFLGGMEGVIWSDVIQGILLIGGAILVLVLGILTINGGWSTVINDALANDKLITADNFKLGTAAAAIPIIFIGSIFNNLHQYTASQDVVQRYQKNKINKRNESILMDKWYSSINHHTDILWNGYRSFQLLFKYGDASRRI